MISARELAWRAGSLSIVERVTFDAGPVSSSR